jgi:hypothetical protein
MQNTLPEKWEKKKGNPFRLPLTINKKGQPFQIAPIINQQNF